ncbi:hypothetical protein [Clostridium sp.]|jgi:lipoprotein|uniref:hypothetical protein n=1 Tax=Clostridium sp. TaxID=1506 RepID=UPI0025E95A11|nr:hypothetical protein [Clostridium sp.]MDY2631196.1 hypothetical protein [Clostridium sp.]
MKKLLIYLLFSTLLLTACSLNKSANVEKTVDSSKKEVTNEVSNSNLEENDNSKDTNEISQNNTSDNSNSLNENISEKVKDYIINGQENKSEAKKLKWSKRFLNEVNIEDLYSKYIKDGGNEEDIEELATYVTLNAPILSNWEELFKKDLYDTYNEEVVKLEHLEGDLYQAYVNKNGSEVPFVVVSSRTGYFHG